MTTLLILILVHARSYPCQIPLGCSLDLRYFLSLYRAFFGSPLPLSKYSSHSDTPVKWSLTLKLSLAQQNTESGRHLHSTGRFASSSPSLAKKISSFCWVISLFRPVKSKLQTFFVSYRQSSSFDQAWQYFPCVQDHLHRRLLAFLFQVQVFSPDYWYR